MSARRFIPAVVVILITLGTYLPILGNEFVLQDDVEWIEKNSRLNPPSWEHLLDCWRRPMQGLYVPVTYTLWSALALLGTKPIVFHAASVLLHVLSALMVMGILRRLFNDEWSACLGALLFSLHPLQVESVAWASGMKDILGGLLSLIMIDQYLRHISVGPMTSRGRLHYAIAILSLALALLSKPSAVMAPVIAGAIDVLLIRKSLWAAIERLWLMVFLILPCIWWSREVQSIWPETITPLWTRPLIAGDALSFYLIKLFYARESDRAVWTFAASCR